MIAWLVCVPPVAAAPIVQIAAGRIAGSGAPGGVAAYLGIPYAAPPTGARRWRPPGIPRPWSGVRDGSSFGPRCVQARLFADMVFRDTASEDCLYINVWAASAGAPGRRPVMVWIHGGAFQSGSASEPRQDGARLASAGVVVVSFNYRLGVFGFLAHAQLSAESGHGASGNYGLMDQIAALEWVRQNIAAFGGDPGNVTIFGESSGSFAVSALMAAPLANGLFHRAIGESGAYFRPAILEASALPAAEAAGEALVKKLDADSVGALRELSAEAVLDGARGFPPFQFAPIIDGDVLPRDVASIYEAGEQARVPLLAGWNADEIRSDVTLAKTPPSAESFAAAIREQFGNRAAEVLAVYPAGSAAELIEAAAAFASDMFVSASTRSWIEAHRATGGSPVYRYLFSRQVPVAAGLVANGRKVTARDTGARHAGEIEYVFGTLASVPGVKWSEGDRRLSSQLIRYWTNFARTGNPNGRGLPIWPTCDPETGRKLMRLDLASRSEPERWTRRYTVLERIARERSTP